MTNKQTLFIKYYLTHFNATKAALDAGYNPNTATEIGYENLTKPHIKKEIEEEVKRVVERSDEKIAKLIKKLDDMIDDPETRPADKLKAMDMLGKYLKMFTDRIEVSGQNGEPIEVKWQK